MKKIVEQLEIGLLALLFAVGCYRMVLILDLNDQTELIKAVMAVCGLALLLYCYVNQKRGVLTGDQMISCILIFGIVMRAGYLFYSGGDLQSGEAGRFANSDKTQYYQEPFLYLVGGLISRLVNVFFKSQAVYTLTDAERLVSCAASCLSLFASEKLCRMAGLKEKERIVSLSLIAFLPAMYLTGSRADGDAVHTLFLLLAFYGSCQWYQEQSWKNIIFLALVYGFGMMNRLAICVMAIVTAGVFLSVLWKTEDKKKLVSQLGKYAVFFLISLPIGLWHLIRNTVLLGWNFLYVSDSALTLGGYCGTYSLVQRFVAWDVKNLFSAPYADPGTDYNLPVYLIKTALFGDLVFEINDVIPTVLLVSAAVLVFFGGCAFCQAVRMGKKEPVLFFLAMAATLIYLSAVSTAYRYPYGCSMDFRYSVILGIFMAVLLGKSCDMRHWGERYKNIAAVTFCLSSCVMYLWI